MHAKEFVRRPASSVGMTGKSLSTCMFMCALDLLLLQQPLLLCSQSYILCTFSTINLFYRMGKSCFFPGAAVVFAIRDAPASLLLPS